MCIRIVGKISMAQHSSPKHSTALLEPFSIYIECGNHPHHIIDTHNSAPQQQQQKWIAGSIQTSIKRRIHIKLPFRFHTYSYCSNRIRLHCNFCCCSLALWLSESSYVECISITFKYNAFVVCPCDICVYSNVVCLHIQIELGVSVPFFFSLSQFRSSLFTTDTPHPFPSLLRPISFVLWPPYNSAPTTLVRWSLCYLFLSTSL